MPMRRRDASRHSCTTGLYGHLGRSALRGKNDNEVELVSTGVDPERVIKAPPATPPPATPPPERDDDAAFSFALLAGVVSDGPRTVVLPMRRRSCSASGVSGRLAHPSVAHGSAALLGGGALLPPAVEAAEAAPS